MTSEFMDQSLSGLFNFLRKRFFKFQDTTTGGRSIKALFCTPSQVVESDVRITDNGNVLDAEAFSAHAIMQKF